MKNVILSSSFKYKDQHRLDMLILTLKYQILPNIVINIQKIQFSQLKITPMIEKHILTLPHSVINQIFEFRGQRFFNF